MANAGSARTCIPFDDALAAAQKQFPEAVAVQLTPAQFDVLRERVRRPFPITRAQLHYSPNVANDRGEPVLQLVIEAGGCARAVAEFTPQGLRTFFGIPVELP